jgi:tRNA1Val (adenine37-N6)-methyltransferase
MRDDFFTFKQFKIRHRDAAMKVGTDAVLLGSWAFDTTQPKRILDVGTGCGILALMLAQRFEHAQIEAVELEEKAKQEADYNFEQSPFRDRLNARLGNFLSNQDSQQYDAIICNPPYFQDKISSSVPERNMARQERFLPPLAFWKKVKSLMNSNGLRIAVVLPIDRMGAWEAMAIDEGFCLVRKCWIKGNAGSDVSRVLLEWSSIPFSALEEMEVVIEDSRGVLNASYQKWTHPFLLEK